MAVRTCITPENESKLSFSRRCCELRKVEGSGSRKGSLVPTARKLFVEPEAHSVRGPFQEAHRRTEVFGGRRLRRCFRRLPTLRVTAMDPANESKSRSESPATECLQCSATVSIIGNYFKAPKIASNFSRTVKVILRNQFHSSCPSQNFS